MKRKNNSILLLATVLSLIIYSNALADSGCVVISDVFADVLVAGKQVHLEPRAPRLLQQCNSLKVDSDHITACYLTQNGLRTCTRIAPGKELRETLMSSDGMSIAEAFHATLAAFMEGDSQIKVGQTRGNIKLSGLPYGRIVVLGKKLEIILAETGLSEIKSLQIENANGEEESAIIGQLIDGKMMFNAEDLSPGANYRWRLKTAQHEYSHTFSIADQTNRDRMSIKVDEIDALSNSELGRAILAAELYLQNGYIFNARHELARQGLIGR